MRRADAGEALFGVRPTGYGTFRAALSSMYLGSHACAEDAAKVHDLVKLATMPPNRTARLNCSPQDFDKSDVADVAEIIASMVKGGAVPLYRLRREGSPGCVDPRDHLRDGRATNVASSPVQSRETSSESEDVDGQPETAARRNIRGLIWGYSAVRGRAGGGERCSGVKRDGDLTGLTSAVSVATIEGPSNCEPSREAAEEEGSNGHNARQEGLAVGSGGDR